MLDMLSLKGTMTGKDMFEAVSDAIGNIKWPKGFFKKRSGAETNALYYPPRGTVH